MLPLLVPLLINDTQAEEQPKPAIDTKPASEEKLEVGALTEWDPLKEIIVGGYDAVWP